MFMLVPLYWEEHEQPYDYWRFTQFCLRTMLEEVGFVGLEINPINANWSIFGMHLVRMLNSRRITRFMVPYLNLLFCKLDQKSLQRRNNHSNVMTYAVKAIKK